MRVTMLAAASLLAACHSLDPRPDRAAVADEVAVRTEAPATNVPAGLDAAISDEVTTLLRAPLSDAAAVRILLLNNHTVRARLEQLGVGRADLVQAGLLRNPVFDLDARFLDAGTELEFGLAQPFLDLFFRPLRQRLAEHEFAAAQAMVTDELVHLVFAVRRALVDVRATAQLTAVQRDALRTAEAGHELMAALHAAGNATDQALAIERVGETRARLDLAAAELAAHEAREPVQRLLGLWGEHTEWTVAGELADDPLGGVDLAAVESRVVARSLELTAHRARIDALAVQADLDDRLAWTPDGELGVSAVREPGGEYGFGPRFALELPLLDGGSARRVAARARLAAGMHDHAQLAVELRSAARVLRDRAGLLAERVRFLREQHLPARVTVVTTTLQTYNAMQIGVFDVLQQQRLQLADRRELVQSLRAAHQARIDLQELLAGSLPESALRPFTLPSSSPTEATRGGH
ncbi:MAG: TolC family protein [Planctomycetes bacterium]|nr:TolC family protein [Planctomycetota bacterium]